MCEDSVISMRPDSLSNNLEEIKVDKLNNVQVYQ